MSLIVAGCVCRICKVAGTPFSCGCWIRLACVTCSKRRWVQRGDHDPERAIELRFECPDCEPDQLGPVAYFDVLGNEVPL